MKGLTQGTWVRGLRCRRSQRTLVLLLWSTLALLLSGCGKYSWWGRSANVTPGEADYPSVNPNPTRFLELTGTAPKSIRIRIEAVYLAGVTYDIKAHEDPENCGYMKAAFGASSLFNVTEVVALTWGGERYHARVAVDHLQPGRCHWYLQSINYLVPAAAVGDEPHPSGEILVQNEEAPSSADGNPRVRRRQFESATEVTNNIWCRKELPAEQGHDRLFCGFLNNVSPEKSTTVPEAIWGGTAAPSSFGATTREVVIDFHDADAIASP